MLGANLTGIFFKVISTKCSGVNLLIFKTHQEHTAEMADITVLQVDSHTMALIFVLSCPSGSYINKHLIFTNIMLLIS